MRRTAVLEATLATIPDAVNVGPRTVVALPPSDLDPRVLVDGTVYDDLTVYDETTTYFASYVYDLMRVYVGGSLITRAYDTTMDDAAGDIGTYGSYESGY